MERQRAKLIPISQAQREGFSIALTIYGKLQKKMSPHVLKNSLPENPGRRNSARYESSQSNISPLIPRNKEEKRLLFDIYDNLQKISLLQQSFNQSLKKEYSPEDLLTRSYNPVVARWHVEQLRTHGTLKDLEEYELEERENLKTTIMERLYAAESIGKFVIIDGQLYSEYFPDEPFSNVLLRGYLYRQKLYEENEKRIQENPEVEKIIPETEREGWLGELTGWEEINKLLTDSNTPVGTKIILFSPPGMVHGTAYKGRFVDEFELMENEDGKYVKRTRIAVDYDDEGYKNKAEELDPDFFKAYDNRPLDAWYESNPIRCKETVSLFQKAKKAMSPETFNTIYYNSEIIDNKTTLREIIDYYIKILFADRIDWEKLAVSFNAILNRADELQEKAAKMKAFGIDNSPNKEYRSEIESARRDTPLDIYIDRLGRQPVKTVSGGGGCPDSKGFAVRASLDSFISKDSIVITNELAALSNSVAQFGVESSGTAASDGKCVRCPFCNNIVDAIIEGRNWYCPNEECSRYKRNASAEENNEEKVENKKKPIPIKKKEKQEAGKPKKEKEKIIFLNSKHEKQQTKAA